MKLKPPLTISILYGITLTLGFYDTALAQATGSARAQEVPLLSQMNESVFNIFCDPNGGGTGQCTRFDTNEELNCSFASQDFIRCQSSNSHLSICIAYAPSQFTCKDSGVKVLDEDGNCNDPLSGTSTCQPPLKPRFQKKSFSESDDLPPPIQNDLNPVFQ